MSSKRRNIALIGVGIIGIPVLTDILSEISNGVNLTVYSFIPLDKKDIPRGVRVRYLPRGIHQRLKYLLLATRFIVDHCQRRYDVIHAQSAFPGGVLARVLGRTFRLPWMVTLIGGEVEAMPSIPFGDLLNTKLRAITTKVCAEADVLTVMSHFQAGSVRDNLNIHRSIRVLPYAPTVGILARKELTSPIELLHVGYHHPVKNQRMLLHTVARLVGKIPFKLTIIGANYNAEFRHLVKELNLDDYVQILGSRTYDEMHLYYEKAHVLVHTSWYEGLPTVAFEAMARGAVVCGTNVGILSDFSGLLCRTVAPGDDAALANLLLEIAGDPLQYDRLRQKAFEWASANDRAFYVKEMLSIYQQLSSSQLTSLSSS